MRTSTTPTVRAIPAWPARIKASLIDYLVIVAWLLVLTGFGFVLRVVLPAQAGPPNLIATDLFACAITVLPVWLYLTMTEGSPDAATLGKRIGRLTVTADPDGRAPLGRIALRNGIKLLPWQLAHLAVSRFIYGVEFGVAITLDCCALLLAVVSVMMAMLDPERRALHDRLAGTRVVSLPAVTV